MEQPRPLQPTQGQPSLVLNLLGMPRMWLQTPAGMRVEVPLAPGTNCLLLLYYLAWRRGTPVSGDLLAERVFDQGREADRDTLLAAFTTHKKLLRGMVREAIRHLNARAGQEVVPLDTPVITYQHGLYRLAPSCHVSDLETVEQCHLTIEQAEQAGVLVGLIPETIKEQCDQLLAAYPGDFLATLIACCPDDFEPKESCWVREPLTRYKDAYLQALWYAAEYERRMGLATAAKQRSQEQREHWARAAGLYRRYAMEACTHPFDDKARFSIGGRKPGERMVMSERAFRLSVIHYGAIGEMPLVDMVSLDYESLMRKRSNAGWEPDQETCRVTEQARQQAEMYQLAVQDAEKLLQASPPL